MRTIKEQIDDFNTKRHKYIDCVEVVSEKKANKEVTR